ncbi:lipoate--protein ligase [Harryflintia acetispora]|uniref:lipoate--protein ligase n=1 Tax=Harryflintia acetispora TaxID=1849041 RepID=A0A9X8Y860_9FIRM|nr:lipoate--protein ligase [Harryflintia acetispora]TCL43170.1 lipoate-protein ligase A [Harryflintia acetispora]
MITKLSCVLCDETEPYHNLALEEYLLSQVEEGECILYLWQNRHTVVIGKNQNAWKECRLKELERDGGFLARRLSGGGAVFHDLGNLNFTFLLRREDYDLERQLRVIEEAARSLGIEAQRSGRNDVLAAGRKFSGNAFYLGERGCYHHGTLLVDVDMENLSRYLCVSQDKLQSKGVDSVRARVVNLRALCGGLTVGRMKEAMLGAFARVYGGVPKPLKEERLDGERIAALRERYASWEWRFGRDIPFQYEFSHRFAWGEIDIRLAVRAGEVIEAEIYSDAMDAPFIDLLRTALCGCRFSWEELSERVAGLALCGERAEMRANVLSLLRRENF